MTIAEFEKCYEYADGIVAHMDSGGKINNSNVYDLAKMVMELSPEIARRESFCAGFTTEQLQAGSLGELVGALRQIQQRANESGTSESAFLETVHAMHGCAVAALTPFKGGNDAE